MVRERCASTGCKNEFPASQLAAPAIVWSSVAIYRIAPGIAEVGIVDAKLRVVQQVEGLVGLRHRKQKPAPGNRPSMGNRFCRAE